MRPNTFKRVVISLIATIVALVLWGGSRDSKPGPMDPGFDPSPAALADRAQEVDVHPADQAVPGAYPAAPSTAVGMTPVWRRFADTVDRICALSWNYALADEARTERRANSLGWSEPLAEAAVVRVWAREDLRIHKATTQIGKPPERPVLFQRWRNNVGARTGLFFDAASAASRGNFDQEGRILNKIDQLKQTSDKLGQRFGLQICTSN
jgi:hypothetical protein